MRLIYLLALLWLPGCKAAQQASQSSSSSTSSTARKDSLVYLEKWRTDTVRLKGDSVTVQVPVPCDTSAGSVPVSGKARSGRVNLTYTISGGQLAIACNADSLLLEIYKREVEIYSLQERLSDSASMVQQTVTLTQTVTRYRTPFWNWVLIVALLAWILRWQLVDAAKVIAKIPLPWK